MKLQKVNIADLRPHPMNYNTHPENQLRELEKSLEQFGQFKNIVVCNKTIIAGHGLIEAAKRKGMTEIYALVRNDLTEDQQKALLVTDNATPFLAVPDTKALEDLLKSITDLSFDDIPGMTDEWLESMDVSLDELFKMSSPDEDDPAADEVPEVDEPITKVGDLWQLGKHRLLCGDATKREDVDRLLNGEKADMVFTDPPYGVSYVGKTKDALTIKSDDMNEADLSDLIEKSFSLCDTVLRDGAYVLATVPAGPLHILFVADWKKRGWLRQILVWNKNSLVFGRSEYHYKHEPILFGWKKGDRLKNNDRTRTSVWDFDRPTVSKEHPTMKPVSMWVYGINNHSRNGDLLYEPFGGSGTSLIACEKTGRKCFMMELDSWYCTVIIRRWEQYTGQEAKRITLGN